VSQAEIISLGVRSSRCAGIRRITADVSYLITGSLAPSGSTVASAQALDDTHGGTRFADVGSGVLEIQTPLRPSPLATERTPGLPPWPERKRQPVCGNR
jgi:hypothetical protein